MNFPCFPLKITQEDAQLPQEQGGRPVEVVWVEEEELGHVLCVCGRGRREGLGDMCDRVADAVVARLHGLGGAV